MAITEQKVLLVHLKTKKDLLIPSANIKYVEEINAYTCRVYYADKYIDICRPKEWMLKHLTQDYVLSDANEY